MVISVGSMLDIPNYEKQEMLAKWAHDFLRGVSCTSIYVEKSYANPASSWGRFKSYPTQAKDILVHLCIKT